MVLYRVLLDKFSRRHAWLHGPSASKSPHFCRGLALWLTLWLMHGSCMNDYKHSAEPTFLLHSYNFQLHLSPRKHSHHTPAESNCTPVNKPNLTTLKHSHDSSSLHCKSLTARAQNAPANSHCSAMSTRRTRRTAAAAEFTEEVTTTVETRAKRTRGGQRKATTTKTTSTKTRRESTPPTASTPNARDNTQTTTRSDAVTSTPAPATARKRRLRSTTQEAASPLRALDEQPAKRPRTASKKATAPSPAPAQPTPVQEEDEEEEERGIFFSKSEPQLFYPSHSSTLIERPPAGFDVIALELQKSLLESRIAELEATCQNQSAEILQLHARNQQLENENLDLRSFYAPKSPTPEANTPPPEFDSFDVEQSEPTFVTGSESALALLRHVQEAARPPQPDSPTPSVENLSAPKSPSPVSSPKASTPSRSLFGSFASPFTAIKNLFGSSTPAPPSPTPSRPPPAGTITEVLSMPPTPVGERPKRPNKKGKKPSRMVKALLQGVDAEDAAKAAEWASEIAKNDFTIGDKRKRLETPVLFRDLQHFPSRKPWQSGFSLPEDVLDLEDDDVVPAWAVYVSLVEEEERQTKKTKTVHASVEEDDMPASLNEVFGVSTASKLEFQPRRSIDPSPMFDTPLHHQEGGNVFNELKGHDAVVSDRENLQRELKAGSMQRQTDAETRSLHKSEVHPRAHDPNHGSFSVPDSDSDEDEAEEVPSEPVWTQAPPPAPTPSHAPLPAVNHNEEVERQRQKLMKHTPHKPSRLQQVSYPSPSLFSDAGNDSILAASPLKFSELFGEIPEPEPLVWDDPELKAALESAASTAAVEAIVASMNWSQPTITYDSDEEELSPV